MKLKEYHFIDFEESLNLTVITVNCGIWGEEEIEIIILCNMHIFPQVERIAELIGSNNLLLVCKLSLPGGK